MGTKSRQRNRDTFRRAKQRRNVKTVAQGGYVNQSRKITQITFNAGNAKSVIQPVFEIGTELDSQIGTPIIHTVGDMLVKFDSLTAKLRMAFTVNATNVLAPYEMGLAIITTPQVLTIGNNYSSTVYQDLDLMIGALMSGANFNVPFVYKHTQTIPKVIQFDTANNSVQYGIANKVWHIPRPYVNSLELVNSPRRYQYICFWCVWAAPSYNDFLIGTLELVERLRIVNQKQSTMIKELH
jgi:hypothetical protein